MTVRSGWLLNASEATPGQSRADTRLAPLGTMVPAGALSTRPGVIPGNNALNLTGSGMSGTLGVGRAIVAGTSSQGAYPVVVTVAEPIAVPNGDPSNPRIDSVFLIVYDRLFDTSGNLIAQVQYAQGTPAASPTAPNAPATTNSALRLWDITVAAGSSAGSPINWGTALTDRRIYTSAVGGINPDGTTAGWYSGQYRDGGSTTGLERYNGSAWESRVYLGTSGQLVIGSDVNLLRDSANVLRTNDSFTADGNVSVGGNLSVTGVGQLLTARKTANQSIANSTVQTDDTHLTFSVAANATYIVDGLLVYGADPAVDMKLGFLGPAGATFDWNIGGQDGTQTGTSSPVITDAQAIGSFAFILGGVTNNAKKMSGRLNGLLVTSGTAGTFKYTWAQQTSSANATIMYTGSYMRLHRIA